MQIQEIINRLEQFDTVCSEGNMSLLATAQILNDNKIGALPVVDENYELIGVVSERDIVQFIAENPEIFFSSTVEAAMTSKVITCGADDEVADVYSTLISNKIRHIPVIENDELTVMLSIRDFDKADIST